MRCQTSSLKSEIEEYIVENNLGGNIKNAPGAKGRGEPYRPLCIISLSLMGRGGTMAKSADAENYLRLLQS